MAVIAVGKGKRKDFYENECRKELWDGVYAP